MRPAKKAGGEEGERRSRLNSPEFSRHLGARLPSNKRRRFPMLVVFEAMSRRAGAAVNDDVLFGFRLRLFGVD